MKPSSEHPSKFISDLEKKFDEEREKGIEVYCLYCDENKVTHKDYNLCEECREDFGHNYLREL